MKPLVSICIPAYNAELFIEETLDSALSQTYPNIEIIVSDDASTDNTVAIVRKYQKSGVVLVENPKNQGMSANFNRVIRHSSGKYVLKLDADDLIDPNYVVEQIQVLESDPEITFAHCACRLIDVNGKLIGYERSIHGSFIRSGIDEWLRYVFGPRAVNIVTIRRSAFDLTDGYDERYVSSDWKMHRDLLILGKVFYNDHVLASYRVHKIGKRRIPVIHASERILHISDIRNEWPEEVGGKEKLLIQLQKKMGVKTAIDAAFCSNGEQEEVLEIVPLISQDIASLAISFMVKVGLSPLIVAHQTSRLWLRQTVKQFLYK